MGKSRLLYEWCREKPHLHFFAARLPGQVLLHEFGQQLAVALGQPERTFADWDSALLALAELAHERRFVVVIDEYPYLVDSVPGFSTLLQRSWDTVLQHTNLFLCLTGSTYSVMRREILDGAAPLYRRHTWAYELLPLTLAVFMGVVVLGRCGEVGRRLDNRWLQVRPGMRQLATDSRMTRIIARQGGTLYHAICTNLYIVGLAYDILSRTGSPTQVDGAPHEA